MPLIMRQTWIAPSRPRDMARRITLRHGRAIYRSRLHELGDHRSADFIYCMEDRNSLSFLLAADYFRPSRSEYGRLGMAERILDYLSLP